MLAEDHSLVVRLLCTIAGDSADVHHCWLLCTIARRLTLVHGKNKKSREVGLGRRSRQLLHRYIHRERQAPKEQPHIFLGRTQQPLTPTGLDRILYRLKHKAGLRNIRVGAHVWRHTYAFNYIAQGGDVLRLSKLLGHSSVATTQGYLSAFTARDARRGSVSVLDSLS